MHNHYSPFFKSLFCSGLCTPTTKTSTIVPAVFIDLFLFGSRETNFPKLIALLQDLDARDIDDFIKLLIFIRNPRTGKGERLISRYLLQWLLINYPTKMHSLLPRIPDFGRWDDIFWLFPGAVNLDNIKFVRTNYLSNITKHQLAISKQVQKSIVKFISDQMLEMFHDFMHGKKAGLLAKWLPLENSALNKKFKIVETLIEQLQISFQDYRIVYLRPMRQSLDLCETSMCAQEWSNINYDNIGNRCLFKHRNAFRRHDHRRFTNWGKSKAKPYYIRPQLLVNKCLDDIMYSSHLQDRSTISYEWCRITKFIDTNSDAIALPVIDVRGGLYAMRGKVRLISMALALALIFAYNKRSIFKNYVLTCQEKNEIQIKKIKPLQIKNSLNTLRVIFTVDPTASIILKKVLDYISEYDACHEKIPKTVVYFASHDIKLGSDWAKICNAFKDNKITQPRLISWNMCSEEISYRKIDTNCVMINGYRDDIFRYFLVYGDYDPESSVEGILKMKF